MQMKRVVPQAKRENYVNQAVEFVYGWLFVPLPWYY